MLAKIRTKTEQWYPYQGKNRFFLSVRYVKSLDKCPEIPFFLQVGLRHTHFLYYFMITVLRVSHSKDETE